MFKELKIISIISLLFISLNYSLASAPLTIEYEFISREEVLIQTKNLSNKSVNEKINMVYDQSLMECQIKRYNDFYGIRQFRCFVPCVFFIESEDSNCYQLEDREDNYFIISVNLENPNIIGVQFHHDRYSYYIETENEKGEIVEARDESSMHTEYIYYLSKYREKNSLDTSSAIVDNKIYESITINNLDMYNNLKGRILLQVESAGEAYYIHSNKQKMYYLGRPDDAFSIMREQGIGITNSDLAKIPVSLDYLLGPDTSGDGLPDDFKIALGLDLNSIDSDGDGYSDYEELLYGYNPLGPGKLNYDLDFAKNNQGRIFLQVESHGEAWYVSPENNKRYFLGRPADAFSVMRNLGLGISNENLEKLKGLKKFNCGQNIRFTYNGSEVIYKTIEKNNLCWLDRDLGAEPMPFNPATDATGRTDKRLYGDLFQWGRGDDDHQLRTSEVTLKFSNSESPGHSKFILDPWPKSNDGDWLVLTNNNLWQGINGINNPCPNGWRLPTETELKEERESWSQLDSQGAFNSTLKWPSSGYRDAGDGAINGEGERGIVWGQDIVEYSWGEYNSVILYWLNYTPIRKTSAFMGASKRAYGNSVRCVSDL